MGDASTERNSFLRLRYVVVTVVVVFLVWVGVFIYQRATLTPGKSGKFNGELTRLVVEAQVASAGERNAWKDFVDAGELHMGQVRALVNSDKRTDWPQGRWPPAASDVWDPETTPEMKATIRTLINSWEAQGLLTKLDAVAAGKRFVRPVGEERVMEILLPELGNTRALARFCKGRMYFAAADHDGKEFVRSARHALTLAAVCKKQFSIIDHLVGIAMDSLIADTIGQAVRDGMLDATACRELLSLLDAVYTPVDPSAGIKSERIVTRDAVEWTHSDDANGDGRIIPSVVLELAENRGSAKSGEVTRLKKLAMILGPSKKQTLAKFDEYFALAEAQALMPLRERLGGKTPPADEFFKTIDTQYAVVRYYAPSVGQYMMMSDRGDLEIAGAKVMLALEVHRAAHGNYPATLAALDPPLTSLKLKSHWREEFRYTRFDAAAVNFPYVLYWIGTDATDDAGRAPDSGENQPPFTPEAVGYDYVFNLPRAGAKPKEPDGSR
ncbi:MAG: hypothetical protein AABZ53_00650 [Planctomycetota bacterium]